MIEVSPDIPNFHTLPFTLLGLPYSDLLTLPVAYPPTLPVLPSGLVTNPSPVLPASRRVPNVLLLGVSYPTDGHAVLVCQEWYSGYPTRPECRR